MDLLSSKPAAARTGGDRSCRRACVEAEQLGGGLFAGVSQLLDGMRLRLLERPLYFLILLESLKESSKDRKHEGGE